jgi:lambda family phage portal protein
MKLFSRLFGAQPVPPPAAPRALQPVPPPAAPRAFQRVRVTTGSRFGQRMYAGAQVTRLNTDWPITLTSANAEILVSAIALRSRNRQLERDDDYMRNMLFLLENNVVGHRGIKFLLKVKGEKGSYDTPLIREIRGAWKRALRRGQCTVSRNLSGTELQRLAVRCLARDGVILFRIHRSFGNDFGFALEPIECDRLDHNWNRPAGTERPDDPYRQNEIQFGVEMDQFKAPVAYHILTRHPGDVFAWRAGPKYRERVPARDILAIWTIERAGQFIGMPLWPSIGARLNHVHKYEEAELVAARVAAAKGGWFKKDPNGPQAAHYEGPEDDQGNKLTNTEPGMWEELPVGWDPVQNDPKHPMDAFPYFMKAQLRGASAGANLPYNSVANDLEGVNYSSIRVGLLDARDGFKFLQELMAGSLMEPWFEAWLPFAILSGQLKLGLERIPEILDVMHWYGRRWGWVDPLKDIQADVMAVEKGFNSRRRVIAESVEGGDVEEIFEEQEEDQKLAELHGLKFAVDEPQKTASPEAEEKEDKAS